MDWFAARKLAENGVYIRRAGWTDHWLVLYYGGLWWIQGGTAGTHVVQAGDFGQADFLARDWTDQPTTADPCAALTQTPQVYGDWGSPIMTPPSAPGFVPKTTTTTTTTP